ncbi:MULTISPECIES: DUF3892 domain-containing protein [Clostridium]|uniref:DUF3892 domain-containing protein n=9 Tax=Clostridium TaxID=1485 RepID=A0A1V9I6G2_CLOSG|nr:MULTISPECIES: DUF3892 domain-containing protein [Clostridium]AJD26562.1 hypothetical protein T257_1199 [Clostridium botulinum CDC_297]EKN42683.1 hypothetical protein CFSAN001627_05182 [Clostridium botulinum CFSAN001627]EKX80896.1 hypothetical protein CFSAN001628_003601 [Clostridium botulinum CFSAN001628]EPS48532.1 hypothetical protein CFSAN002368_20701 [Clostridium botulinum A1 str. CFSAN002368]MBE6077359.1 DUF3892 domain-containing protein [Clostridium lundense]
MIGGNNNFGKDIVALVKDGKGAVTGYKLNNGELLTKEQAIERAAEGEINDVVIGTAQNGEQYLHGIPEKTGGIDLQTLPTVKQNSFE